MGNQRIVKFAIRRGYFIIQVNLFIEKDKNFDDDDNDIMSHLNYRKLEEIKKDFMKNEDNGLSIE